MLSLFKSITTLIVKSSSTSSSKEELQMPSSSPNGPKDQPTSSKPEMKSKSTRSAGSRTKKRSKKSKSVDSVDITSTFAKQPSKWVRSLVDPFTMDSWNEAPCPKCNRVYTFSSIDRFTTCPPCANQYMERVED